MKYENLKKLRESLGMTQEEFAKTLGVSKTTYNNYETGAREPKANFWIAVADKYGVTVDFLLGVDKTANKKTTPAPESSEAEEAISKNADDIFNILEQSGIFEKVSREKIERAIKMLTLFLED